MQMDTICVVLAMALAGPGCGAPTSTGNASTESPVVTAESASWQPDGEIRVYDASNLWDAINGAADGYLAYGFRELRIQEFSTGDLRASVEIYDLGTPLGAFGVFRRDQSNAANEAVIDAGTVLFSPHHCAMFHGPHYLQVRALDGALTTKTCQSLTSMLSAKLPGPSGPPPELAQLPEDNRVAGSEGFTKEGYLGLADLKNCLHAKYRGPENTLYELFAIIASEGENIDTVWSLFTDGWNTDRSDVGPILHRSVPYSGVVVLVRTDQRILGIARAGGLEISLELLERAAVH